MVAKPRLNDAKAAHPATLQYAYTVLKTGGNEGFFMILMAKVALLMAIHFSHQCTPVSHCMPNLKDLE
jgi:hypothetical protein